MTDADSDAPNVRIVPPLVYLGGLAIGFLASLWVPVHFIPDLVGWTLGAILIVCGAALTSSALVKFKRAGTTVRPDRAARTLVIAGPYKMTRNPMYLGLALVYLGIAIAGQSLWAVILLPLVLIIIQRRAIAPEEDFLKRRFGADYISYMAKVRRWL
jgi:protein-S-isoprenylcysteine O-methyltransferase Ste14